MEVNGAKVIKMNLKSLYTEKYSKQFLITKSILFMFMLFMLCGYIIETV